MPYQYSVSTKIYDAQLLEEAIEDFSEVWELSFKKWILEIPGESEEESQEIFHEFMNYVLSL